jgi:3-deoxy-D-manno-octulosonic-acid transferase
MKERLFILNFFKLYNVLWSLALPLLKKNRRLSAGFEKRVTTGHLKEADVWIQAASAGESYLAVKILKTLAPKQPVQVLVTTITTQGRDILKQHLQKECISPNIHLTIEWFPFDRPAIMEKAVAAVQPQVMVLLETEIWPALLFHLKVKETKILILNARLSKKSFNGYLATRFLWRHLVPDLICATSERDVARYQRVFPGAFIDTMPNIKFETLNTASGTTDTDGPLNSVFGPDLPVTILASIRKQEEKQVIEIIKSISAASPKQIIAIFPRHMHRITAWQKKLAGLDISCFLRSGIQKPITEPGIILWDVFGELQTAYAHASAVFVGGSLKPLGGQNFLEPAILGIPTVTGPYYDDFEWVGENLFKQQIVTKADNWQQAAHHLSNSLTGSPDRSESVNNFNTYILSNQGGTQQACTHILQSTTAKAPTFRAG